VGDKGSLLARASCQKKRLLATFDWNVEFRMQNVELGVLELFYNPLYLPLEKGEDFSLKSPSLRRRG